ncbi:MAG: diacylglycerol/lipid kinase family protein [Bacteroidota bacterium]|jgi:diacylglycerol kinase (ATP)
MTRLLFIVNPVSGSGRGKLLPAEFEVFNKNKSNLKADFVFTKYQGHAREIAHNNNNGQYDIIVACGGDGTVNEIAKSLFNTNQLMSIFPLGSGNGLARHYNIPSKLSDFIATMENNRSVSHDAVSINGMLGFNVSGIGFDAHVAGLFGKDGKRGFNSYLRLIVREFSNYHPFQTEIKCNGEVLQTKAFMIPIAVASQFGNNAFISPKADASDGQTDLIVVQRMGIWQVPAFAIRVFTKTISGSSFAKIMRSGSFEIKCSSPQPLHMDGEPHGNFEYFKIETIKSAIKFVVP